VRWAFLLCLPLCSNVVSVGECSGSSKSIALIGFELCSSVPKTSTCACIGEQLWELLYLK
jgi:hypothetical protein